VSRKKEVDEKRKGRRDVEKRKSRILNYTVRKGKADFPELVQNER